MPDVEQKARSTRLTYTTGLLTEMELRLFSDDDEQDCEDGEDCLDDEDVTFLEDESPTQTGTELARPSSDSDDKTTLDDFSTIGQDVDEPEWLRFRETGAPCCDGAGLSHIIIGSVSDDDNFENSDVDDGEVAVGGTFSLPMISMSI